MPALYLAMITAVISSYAYVFHEGKLIGAADQREFYAEDLAKAKKADSSENSQVAAANVSRLAQLENDKLAAADRIAALQERLDKFEQADPKVEVKYVPNPKCAAGPGGGVPLDVIRMLDNAARAAR